MTPAIDRRRLLIVLPSDDAGQRAAWEWVRSLGVSPDLLVPVAFGGAGVGQPDAYAGAVHVLDDPDLDWRRLPTREALARVWAQSPDVALNLADPDDLGAALVVGASPAAVRIGRHRRDREGCYDLMVQGRPDAASAVDALSRLLRQLDPPILPTR